MDELRTVTSRPLTIYAGIGSRTTPPAILASMATIAANLAREGWLLRSGHADGADKAFEQGCDDAGGEKEIWLPWKGFNGSYSMHWLYPDTSLCVKAMEIAASVHPAWYRCNDAARRLHARNVLIVLGADFNTPADRVICWTPDAVVVGGTATALQLAQQYNIPITNLAKEK